jgi:hypothetical protein
MTLLCVFQTALCAWPVFLVYATSAVKVLILSFHLCGKTGEYQDLARVHKLNQAYHAKTYVDVLRALTEYGQRAPDRDSYDSSDLDDPDFRLEVVPGIDEDGNFTGKMVIREKTAPYDEEDEEPSSDSGDFSDGDETE